jgi:hypothetical protein
MAVPALAVADAGKADGHDLLRFSCWDHDVHPLSGEGEQFDEGEYAEEAEEYIRKWALKAHRALTFRLPDATLVAVSAFDHHLLMLGRKPLECWRLQVIGVAVRYRGMLVTNDFGAGPPELRISEYVLRRTYARMAELKPDRVIVTARVHEFNYRSIAACKRVGLERAEERPDALYWPMIGDVDSHIGWH